MSSSENSGSRRVSFLEALGLVFVVLKLCAVINWSWWFVLLPIYGPIALLMVVLLVLGIFYGGLKLCEALFV